MLTFKEMIIITGEPMHTTSKIRNGTVLSRYIIDWKVKQPRCFITSYVKPSKHMVVCSAAQEAGAPHLWVINRKNNNVIFTYT